MFPDIYRYIHSLGDNSELGYVQRRNHVEGDSLLTWAVTPSDSLIELLKHRGADIYQKENLSPSGKHFVIDSKYGITFPSKMPQAGNQIDQTDQEFESIYSEEFHNVVLLVEKLFAAIKVDNNIFIYKRNGVLYFDEMEEIRDNFRKHAKASIAFVVESANPTLWGTISTENDLLIGYIDRFANYDRSDDVSLHYWNSICLSFVATLQKRQIQHLTSSEKKTTPNDINTPVSLDSLKTSTEVFKKSDKSSDFLLIVNKGREFLPAIANRAGVDLMYFIFLPDEIEMARSGSFDEADYIVFETNRNRRKFHIMKWVFENSSILQKYKAIMLADDDVEPVDCNYLNIFNLFIESNMEIGQPALTADSYFAHFLTVQNTNFVYRLVNQIDMMNFILTPNAIANYISIWDETTSGFGLELFLGREEMKQNRAFVVLDDTPMRHSRPIGGAETYSGVDPWKDFHDFAQKHGVVIQDPVVLDGKFKHSNLSEEVVWRALNITGYSRELYDFGRRRNSGDSSYISHIERVLLLPWKSNAKLELFSRSYKNYFYLLGGLRRTLRRLILGL